MVRFYRFMSLEAQAIKCVLYGVAPPHLPKSEKIHQRDSYSKEMTTMLQKHVGSRAVAIVTKLCAGKVGCCKEDKKSTGRLKELCVFVIL